MASTRSSAFERSVRCTSHHADQGRGRCAHPPGPRGRCQGTCSEHVTPSVSMNPGVPVDGADMRPGSLIAAGMLLVCCSVAFAQNPALDVSQYAHKAWKVSEGFAKASFVRLHRRPTAISGWARILACYDSTACGPSRGSHHRGSISPAPTSDACSPGATDVFGLAPLKGLPAGRTAS